MQPQPTAEQMHPYVWPGAPPAHDWTVSDLYIIKIGPHIWLQKNRQTSPGKIYATGGPSLALKEDILFLEIVYFLFWGEQRSCDGRGGAQRLVTRSNAPKKRREAQRTGAHARPKPTSL